MTHTARCRMSKSNREKWEEEHPQFCRKCHGVGSIAYEDDPSPAGVSLSAGTMTFSDLCADCVEEGYCPWCSNSLRPSTPEDKEPGFRCSKCDWNSETSEKVVPIHECVCYEADLP